MADLALKISLTSLLEARMVSNFQTPPIGNASLPLTHNKISSSLSMERLHTLLAVERTMSIISIITTAFLIVTFLLFAELKRKTFNRLLFLASWGNMLTNVATLIGRSGVTAGGTSSTCKVQATLIQWFMPADSLWMFCMAVNVFLTFQTSSLQVDLRKLEKWYFLFCFGVPGVPALTYLFLDVTKGTDYYGDATLWCWIGANHDSLRIITFYGPVWVILLITMTLYAITGRSIYKGQVRNPQIRDQMRDAPSPEDRRAVFLSRANTPVSNLATLTKKTAISQVMERADGMVSSERLPSSASSFTLPVTSSPTPEFFAEEANRVSTFTHISESRQSQPPRQLHNMIQLPGFGDGTKLPDYPFSSTTVQTQELGVFATIMAAPRSPSPQPVTPIESTEQLPSPISRSQVRSYEDSAVSEHPNFVALNVQQNSGRRSRLGSFTPRFSSLTASSTSRTNRGARIYARVAFLLYLTILIVWVPSTVNRIYGIAAAKRDGGVNFGLSLAAAIVLPTQGLFNAFVFCFTSRFELGRRLRDMCHGKFKSDINEIKEIVDADRSRSRDDDGALKSVMEV